MKPIPSVNQKKIEVFETRTEHCLWRNILRTVHFRFSISYLRIQAKILMAETIVVAIWYKDGHTVRVHASLSLTFIISVVAIDVFFTGTKIYLNLYTLVFTCRRLCAQSSGFINRRAIRLFLKVPPTGLFHPNWPQSRVSPKKTPPPPPTTLSAINQQQTKRSCLYLCSFGPISADVWRLSFALWRKCLR